MKLAISLFAVSLALLSSLKAQTTIQDSSVTHYSDGSSSSSRSSTVIRDFDQERREAREQAIEAAKEQAARALAEKQALAAMEPWFRTCAEQGLIPHDRQIRGVYQDWLKQNRQKHEELKRMTAIDHLNDGDPLPLPSAYDDEAIIRMYLHDSGFSDLSDAQIDQVNAYMKANHIHHVSELGL